MAVLQVEDLTKTFDLGFFSSQKVTALDGVNLSLESGQVAFVTGANGSGKTTLMKIISTLILPTSGVVRVGDFNVVEKPHKARELISIVTNEDRSFFWRLSCYENLRFFCILNNLTETILKKRISNITDKLHLDEFLHKRYDQCSTGMKRRLAIARAILNRPHLIILDEPTNSLDPESTDRVIDILRDQVENFEVGVLFVTHQLHELRKLSGSLAVMQEGRLKMIDKEIYLRERNL